MTIKLKIKKENQNQIERKNENKIENETEKLLKHIDYENVTIEKVFHITLSQENPKKYLYFELYIKKFYQ